MGSVSVMGDSPTFASGNETANFTSAIDAVTTVSNNATFDDEVTMVGGVGPAKIAFDVLLIALQIVIMVGMGSIITIQEMWDHFKRPFGIGIALVSQFVVLPASAFGLINLLQLSPSLSLAAMVVSCCPGGSSSNIFCYMCDGDVSLSIVLTTVSTILAVGMMPLNLWIYTRHWQEDAVRVPYQSVAITLAWILAPLVVGMLVKVYLSKIAPFLGKWCGILGMIMIWIALLLQYIVFPAAYSQSWRVWLLVAAIPTAGFVLGYVLALVMRRPHRICRTIAIETGMQSISLAIAVIVTSFPVSVHDALTPFPSLYGLYLTVGGFVLAGVVRVRERLRSKSVNLVYPEPQKQVIATVA